MPSSPNGPCSTGNTTSAPSRPPPGVERELGAVVQPGARSARSARRAPRARPPRRPRARTRRAQRDVVLGRAPAGQTTATLTGVGARAAVRRLGGRRRLRVQRRLEAARRRSSPASPCAAGRRPPGPGRCTMPSWSIVSTVSSPCTRTSKPASRSVPARGVALLVDDVGHVDLRRRLGHDERRPRCPCPPARPRRGPGAARCPDPRPSDSSSVTSARRPAPSSVLRASSSLRPTTSGTLDLLAAPRRPPARPCGPSRAGSSPPARC